MQKNILAPYEWAKEQLKKNIVEFAGKVKHNPAIVFFHSFTSLKATDDETPWCSSFMCAAAELNGFKSTRSAAAKSWLTYGEEVSLENAQEGDICVFKRQGGHHVAFLHYKPKSTDKDVLVLGGNQSNAVRGSKYPMKDLLAIRRFKV